MSSIFNQFGFNTVPSNQTVLPSYNSNVYESRASLTGRYLLVGPSVQYVSITSRDSMQSVDLPFGGVLVVQMDGWLSWPVGKRLEIMSVDDSFELNYPVQPDIISDETKPLTEVSFDKYSEFVAQMISEFKTLLTDIEQNTRKV